MNMNKRTIIWIIIFLIFSVFALTIGWFGPYEPDYPEGTLYDKVTYTINPQTILASMDQESKDIFWPAPPEPEDGWPVLWPLDSFSWGEKDYLKVADALSQLVWKESLDNWHLIRASFNIDQCSEVLSRIDRADLSFYQRVEDNNKVHGFWINPVYGIVTAGNEYSQHNGWTAKWENIEASKTEINSVEAALQFAEEHGGRGTRSTAEYKCRIGVFLAPYIWEYDLLSHPFSRYGWGWSVIYWPVEPNRDPLFSMKINPYTGDYRILVPTK